MKIFLLFLLFFTTSIANEKPLQKVSLQLHWLDQFQYAGYYMAKEKGFYKKAGLDVEIKKFTASTNVLEEVLHKKTTFGIGRSSLINNHFQTDKIILLSAIFQSSPLVLIATDTQNIRNIEDFRGKKIMLSGDTTQPASFLAMMKSHHIDMDTITFKKPTFDIESLISAKVDLYAAYISNEPYILEKKGIAYNVFSPKDYEFDFYSDILFTSRDLSQNSPIMVKVFNEASLKGWEYAFSHINESVDLIYEKYNIQNKTKDALIFEAKELKKLAYHKDIKLGNIDNSKIQRIYDIYKLVGLAKGRLDMDSLIFHTKFTPTEKIINTWGSIEYEYKKEFILIIIFMIIIFFYRQNFLRRNNDKLKILQDELIKANSALKTKVLRVNSDLQKAQEMANIGSWVLDNQNQELRWSLQTYKIFGLDSKINYDCLYDEFLNKIHLQDVDNLKKVYKKSLEDKTNYTLEYRLVMNDGSIKYVTEHCEITFDEYGVALVSYGTVQDITEATISKMDIKEKDLHLLHQSRLAQMGEMLSMIAHQWKQPLGTISASTIAIVMAIELKQYNLDDKKGREDFLKFVIFKLGKVSLYVKNLSNIISDFSDFYKPNKSSEIVELDEVILKVNTLFGESISVAGIVIKFDLDAKCEVYIHENEFMQVILNIVNNAKEQLVFKKIDDAKINIKTYIVEDNVFVEILDNAGGICEENISDIFNPYFSTKLEKNGTGLGLYMSKIIINDYHDGDISVKNVDNGAKFTIRISKW